MGGRTRRGFLSAERGAPSVIRAMSLQARTSSTLAAALMLLVGLGMLGWYYTNAIARQTQARQQAKVAAEDKAQTEMRLPVLGPIEPPRVAAALSRDERQDASDGQALPPAVLPQVPLTESGAAAGADLAALVAAATAGTTPAQLALQRRLQGAPFVSGFADSGAKIESRAGMLPDETFVAAPTAMNPSAASGVAEARGDVGRRSVSLAQWLRPETTDAVLAKVMPTRRLLLPKGSFIDCTLETAIDSTLPGMTTCITAIDTFGADGTVVLLERGTKLVGETRGQVQQASARVFVVWTEARTPSGVVVSLDSPGTDELGRAGLAGKVQRHFWDRFGAAILVSLIDGAVQAAVQSAGQGNGTVIYSPSSSRDVLTEVLKATVNIPPTVVKAHGERIQVLVARDVDFSTVYELRIGRSTMNRQSEARLQRTPPAAPGA